MTKRLLGTLTLEVIYDVPDGVNINVSKADIRGLLEDVADRAAREGLMTGDSCLLVNKWFSKVKVT